MLTPWRVAPVWSGIGIYGLFSATFPNLDIKAPSSSHLVAICKYRIKGTTLLNTLFRGMKDLIDMNIKFDFFINLSFACFPVKATV